MFIIVVSGIRNSYVAVVMAPLLLNGSVCNVFFWGGADCKSCVPACRRLKPKSHRPTRRHKTVEFHRVGVVN